MKRGAPVLVLALASALATALVAASGRDGASDASTQAAASKPADVAAPVVEDTRPSATPDHAACEARIAELTAELHRERELRLERERTWLRYTQGMARLVALAGAPTFEADLPAEEREARVLESARSDPDASAPNVLDAVGASSAKSSSAITPGSTATIVPAGPIGSTAAGSGVAAQPAAPAATAADPAHVDPSFADVARAARLAREQRNRAVFLALRSLFAVEHVSGLDLLEAGTVADGSTGPVVLRVIDDRGRPLGSLYAERLRLEGSHAAHTLSLVLEQGWERRAGERTPFEGGPVDAEGRGGVRRIELPHVDPMPWFDALPELFRADQREAVTQGDPRELNALRFELNRAFRADASGPVFRLESVVAKQGVVLREVHLAVLTPDMQMERDLFADRMSILRAEKGLEIVLETGSQVRGTEKAPFLGGRYRIFLPRADAARWEAAGIPVGKAPEAATAPAPVPAVAPADPAKPDAGSGEAPRGG